MLSAGGTAAGELPARVAADVAPLTVTVAQGVFRLRINAPESLSAPPFVPSPATPGRLLLRLPGAARPGALLGPDVVPPDAPANEASPVRALTIQVVGDDALIILRLGTATPHRLLRDGRAWVLELGSAKAMVAAETLLLDITINGQQLRDVATVEMLADARLALPIDVWQEARLKAPASTLTLPGGGHGYALDDVPGLRYTLDRHRLKLDITAPSQAFAGLTLAAQDTLAAPPPRPQPGGVLNYDLSASSEGKHFTAQGATLEGVFFSGVGSFVSSALVSHTEQEKVQRHRLDSYWQMDFPQRMETLVFGDTVGTGGAWSRPIRYGGVRYGRDFSLRPGFVTLPQASLSGSAALPSSIDVLINNQRRVSRTVPPGPFQLTDVPVTTGAGEINMVARDLLGRETIVSQSYYASPRLLAPGLNDFSLETGWQRNGYATDADTYGTPFGAATLRHGLTPSLTGELRVELERDRRAAGAELAGLLATWGVGHLALARSDSASESGWHSLLGIERSTPTGGGALQWEQFSEGYTQLAQIESEAHPRQRLQCNLSQRLFGTLTAGVSVTRQSSWNAASVHLVGAALSMLLPAQVNLSVYASRQLNGDAGTRAGFTLTRALGHEAIATATLEGGGAGRPAGSVQVSSNTPTGNGIGWRVGASNIDTRVVYGGVNINTQAAEMTADVAASGSGEVATRVNARGSVGMLADMGFASRPIGHGAFAVVRVGDVANVPVLRSHQVVTQTDGRGLAFVPGLLPYQANTLQIDPIELPFDAEVHATSIDVTPYAQSGVLVDFAVRRSRNALLVLAQGDGSVVPPGARAHVLDNDAWFTVAKRGEVYMTDLALENVIEVRWPGGQCRLRMKLPAAYATLPQLGPLTCLPEKAP